MSIVGQTERDWVCAWGNGMSVIWQKVWFDLWHNKVRTLLERAEHRRGRVCHRRDLRHDRHDADRHGRRTSDRSRPRTSACILTSFISRDDALALRSVEGCGRG